MPEGVLLDDVVDAGGIGVAARVVSEDLVQKFLVGEGRRRLEDACLLCLVLWEQVEEGFKPLKICFLLKFKHDFSAGTLSMLSSDLK